jgi:hypothetical protein
MNRRQRPGISQLRAAGRKRAEQFTPEYQREMGLRRAQQHSFLEHNRQIAPDGFRAQSAYMRGQSGLRLLRPEHVQFLLPQQLVGPGGAELSYPQQRIFFGLYVWKAIWEDLAPRPEPPTDEEFLLSVDYVQTRLHAGLCLENPLDVIYAAADDFCDEAGEPWSDRKQRRLFRQALADGQAYAEEQVRLWHEQYQIEREARLRRPGLRRPQANMPIFGHCSPGVPTFQYGRPDLPFYHRYNISPQRPYGVPMTNDHHPVYWIPRPGQEDED